MYDFTVVGAGIFGCTFARVAAETGFKVLLLEKSGVVAGNCYIAPDGRHVHGPHLFHTNDAVVWQFVNRFGDFNSYQHRVKTVAADGAVYTVPFCMSTFQEMWGCATIAEAREQVKAQLVPCAHPTNFEEYALANFGRDLYEVLLEGYTTKQWGRHPRTVPASVAARIPIRYSWDDRYFTDKYQGVCDYTKMCANMVSHQNIELKLCTPFDGQWSGRLVWSGRLENLYPDLPPLRYRGLFFRTERLTSENDLGIGQMNYAHTSPTFTRAVAPYYFGQKCDYITYETPDDHSLHPYYPDGGDLAPYIERAKAGGVILGGRLGSHRYQNMDQTVAQAMSLFAKALKGC